MVCGSIKVGPAKQQAPDQEQGRGTEVAVSGSCPAGSCPRSQVLTKRRWHESYRKPEPLPFQARSEQFFMAKAG